jgi:hypothetical protein
VINKLEESVFSDVDETLLAELVIQIGIAAENSKTYGKSVEDATKQTERLELMTSELKQQALSIEEERLKLVKSLNTQKVTIFRHDIERRVLKAAFAKMKTAFTSRCRVTSILRRHILQRQAAVIRRRFLQWHAMWLQRSYTERTSVLLEVSRTMAMQKDVNVLIRSVVQETRQFLQADRASLFLVSDDGKELWTKVAEGVSEIRLPFGVGESATFPFPTFPFPFNCVPRKGIHLPFV